MNDQSRVICPACGSSNCLFGSLNSGDADKDSNGTFYPSNIRKSSLISFNRPKVHTLDGGVFWGCFECGHLWAKLNVEEFKATLKKENWESGKVQITSGKTNFISIIFPLAIGIFIVLGLYIENSS